MRCWKCGAQVAGSRCLSCGCLQSARQEPTTEIGKALRYAYDKIGAEQILTDHETLRRCLSDLIPEEKKLRAQIASVMQTNAGLWLFRCMQIGGNLEQSAYQNLAYNVQEDCGLTVEQVYTVLGYLLEMIGCEKPRDAKTPPPPEGPSMAPPPPESIPMPPPAPEGPSTPPSAPETPPIVPPEPEGPVYNTDVSILVWHKSVLFENATHGLGGWGVRGKRGDFYVRNDGIAVHMYHGFGTSKPSPAPDIFISRQDIVNVIENFFIGTYACTIVLANGMRFRATIPGRKADVLRTIELIRSLI